MSGMDTPPKTNMDTKNPHDWKEIFFQNIIFRVHVSFQGCNIKNQHGWENILAEDIPEVVCNNFSWEN